MPPVSRKKNTSNAKPKSKKTRLKFQNILQKTFKILLIITVSIFIFSVSIVFFYKWIDPPMTYLMGKRKITNMIAGKPSRIKYEFVPFNQISDYLKLAVICSEDQKFFDHNGFDFVSIAKAMETNKFNKNIKGASTISQQVAKNVFLWDGRNIVRKALEAYYTFLIEIIWGKKRILEVYLNIAEMGNLTFGAESASRKYYHKSCKKLSKDQAVSIAAILPNPILFSATKPTKYIIKKKKWIHIQMQNLGGTAYLKKIQ